MQKFINVHVGKEFWSINVDDIALFRPSDKVEWKETKTDIWLRGLGEDHRITVDHAIGMIEHCIRKLGASTVDATDGFLHDPVPDEVGD
jgi:hypothetical protein